MLWPCHKLPWGYFASHFTRIRSYADVRYPGVLTVSMRKYVYAVLLLDHTVPFPPASEVEHE